jgi:hypothetical protein
MGLLFVFDQTSEAGNEKESRKKEGSQFGTAQYNGI